MNKIPATDVTPDQDETVPLYKKREKIYVREIQGFFQKLRTWTLWALMLAYFGVAWVNVNGQQLVYFDLPARQLLALYRASSVVCGCLRFSLPPTCR